MRIFVVLFVYLNQRGALVMRHLTRFLFLTVLLSAGGFGLSFFVVSDIALAQDNKVAKNSPQSKSTLQELTDAQRRIDRLEAQISEMQSIIGALQTLVQKGVKQNRPIHSNQRLERSRAPLDKSLQLDQGSADRVTGEPQFRTDGWGADTQSEDAVAARAPAQNKIGDDRVPGADLPLDRRPPQSRVAVNGVPSRKLYDAGYNYLMASDYVSAEATFRTFLRNYPEDQLSGNAQYWLGETYFARGNYRKAAHEFLTGYKTYKTSQKAPDNLLKLGMSLQRLGQSEAACQTYTQLRGKFKSLSGHVSRRLGQEQGKAGCK